MITEVIAIIKVNSENGWKLDLSAGRGEGCISLPSFHSIRRDPLTVRMATIPRSVFATFNSK